MDSTGLYELFRADVRDEAQPYLWSDREVWYYANDAYRMFVRLTGGVSDFDSDVCAVDVTAGEAVSDINPSILRIMGATLGSEHRPLRLINFTDLSQHRRADYGNTSPLTLTDRQGEVWGAVLGMRRGVLRWLDVPEADDVVNLQVYRMPLGAISGPGQALVDVDEDHHLHLLKWMKHLAFSKVEAETFDRAAAESYAAQFQSYCQLAKAEWERYKHTGRTTSYGGI